MKLERILPFARTLMERYIEEGSIAIDATCGNGHDTLFLANLVGKTGRVYGFDVQLQAINNTKERFSNSNIQTELTMILDSHAYVKTYIPEIYHGKISGTIFNLGYLPGSDKSVFTMADSTIQAIEACLDITMIEGIVILVVYPGHEEGKTESAKVEEYVKNLPQEYYHVIKYQFLNQQNNPPYILAIEKRKAKD